MELIKTEIRDIDKAVEIGINELTWNSPSQSKTLLRSGCKVAFNRFNIFSQSIGITDYLVELRKPVERLQARMQRTHQNLSEIRSIMSAWAKIPLFERKDGKKDSVLCLDERSDRITKRYSDIESASKVVHR